MKKYDNIESCFIGLALGDALGVPVEFKSRNYLKSNPITGITGHGAWNQPPGTWSDDSSLAFCLAESLSERYDVSDIGKKFVKWMNEGYWGAHDKVFDIGGTTKVALQRIFKGEDPLYSGEIDEESNGNGSLMRIMPASIYFSNLDDLSLMERMREISGITHRHFRSVFSCFIYSKLAAHILIGEEKETAYKNSMQEVNRFLQSQSYNPEELKLFARTLNGSLIFAEENTIQSTGYVLHSLEASIWCFMNTDSYKDAVLRAVNLGGDTDTTSCITGALAGLYYGSAEIPSAWRAALVKEEQIVSLAKKFERTLRRA